ncbi:hypothetical protein ABT314_46930, partial [Streptomyces spiralis]
MHAVHAARAFGHLRELRAVSLVRGLYVVLHARLVLGRLAALRGVSSSGHGGACLGREPGHGGLGRTDRLAVTRNNRFRSRNRRPHRRHHGRLHALCGLHAPGSGALRGRLRLLLDVEVLGPDGGRPGVPDRCARGAAVGQGADRARGDVGDGRAEVQPVVVLTSRSARERTGLAET